MSAAGLYLKTIELDNAGTWFKFETTETILDVTLFIASNIASSSIFMRLDGGTEHVLQRNIDFKLRNVDISRLEFKGNAASGDIVTAFGQTPPVF